MHTIYFCSWKRSGVVLTTCSSVQNIADSAVGTVGNAFGVPAALWIFLKILQLVTVSMVMNVLTTIIWSATSERGKCPANSAYALYVPTRMHVLTTQIISILD